MAPKITPGIARGQPLNGIVGFLQRLEMPGSDEHRLSC